MPPSAEGPSRGWRGSWSSSCWPAAARPPGSGGRTRRRPVVTTGVVYETTAGDSRPTVLNASGYVTARRQATVSAKVTGKIAEVLVEEGMAVAEGQVLARLDNSSERAYLALGGGATAGVARRPRRDGGAAGGGAAARGAHERARRRRRRRAGRARHGAGRGRLAGRAHHAPARADRRLRARDRRPPHGARGHRDPRPVRRGGDLEGRAGRARWSRRSARAAASRARESAPSSTWRRWRSRSTSTRATSTACRTGSAWWPTSTRTPSGTSPAASSRPSRPPIGSGRRSWCGSPSTSSATRASCPTWA